MIATTPVVSIIMPVYNGERFVGRAIASALAQTYTNIELVVVDDGSTDATAAKVRAFQDPRMQYVYQENSRQGIARNNGIRRCAGDYITFLDADDRYLPDKVERQVRFLLANPQFKVVYCNELWFYTKRPSILWRRRRIRPSHNILSDLLKGCFININTVMAERAVFDKAGMFNETRFYSEDWDLWLKIALAGFDFGYLDQDLVIIELKDNTDLPMEKQWMVKLGAIEMFQRLLPTPVEIGGVVYDAKQTIQNLTLRLAVAYLAVGRRKDFLHTFTPACPGPKALVFLVALCLLALPSWLIKKLWKLNRYRNSTLVRVGGLSA